MVPPGRFAAALLAAPGSLGSSGPPPTPERVCGGLARSRVYLNVVGGQVGGPDVVLARAEAEIDRHRDLRLGQLGLHPVPADPVPEPPARRHLLLAVPDRDLIL